VFQIVLILSITMSYVVPADCKDGKILWKNYPSVKHFSNIFFPTFFYNQKGYKHNLANHFSYFFHTKFILYLKPFYWSIEISL